MPSPKTAAGIRRLKERHAKLVPEDFTKQESTRPTEAVFDDFLLRRAANMRSMATVILAHSMELTDQSDANPRHALHLLTSGNIMLECASAMLDLRVLSPALLPEWRKVKHYTAKSLAQAIVGVTRIRSAKDIPQEILEPGKSDNEVLHRIAALIAFADRLVNRAYMEWQLDQNPATVKGFASQLGQIMRSVKTLTELYLKSAAMGTDGLKKPMTEAPERAASASDAWSILKGKTG